MNYNILQIARCTVCFFLACAACSCSDDELETMLSAETTPVTFRVDPKISPIFFDYTEGWRYIGSDTVKTAKSIASLTTINLHQGNHNIIAVKGLDNGNDARKTGVHFDPNTRRFYLRSERDALGLGSETPVLGVATDGVYFWHRQLEVVPYLLPEQTPEYNTPVTAMLAIDPIYMWDMPSNLYSFAMQATIDNVPVVEEIGIDDNSFKLRKEPHELYYVVAIRDQKLIGKAQNMPYFTLCPAEGLHDINLTLSVEVIAYEQPGQIGFPREIRRKYSVKLPPFSLQRGHITVLYGPLYSESTSDWTVEMSPYRLSQ